MSLSRKRKKELRKLQESAGKLWETQQVLVGEAAGVAREASRQLGNYSREQVVPTVASTYGNLVVPTVDRGVQLGRHLVSRKVVPVVGTVVGSALSVWDAANDTRSRIATGGGFELPASESMSKKAEAYKKQATKALSKRLAAFEPAPQKTGLGVGGVVAIVLGVVTAAGVLYAAWQTLRADDELWVADDPLSSPDE